MKYYYVTTLEDGNFCWRITMTEGQFSIASVIEEGVFLFNWREITREQCVDLWGEDVVKKFEDKVKNAVSESKESKLN